MKLLLACLVVLTATSTAGTVPTPPGPPKVCNKEGSPLISVRHLDYKSESGAFAIWPSGGFTSYDKDAKTGKLSNEREQCLAEADFTAAKDALAKATWKFTSAKIHCRAVAANHTEWTVKDKVVWDDRTCGGDIPDAATKQAIELVQALETKVTAKTGAVGSGRGKP
jgi:hypothetical protein